MSARITPALPPFPAAIQARLDRTMPPGMAPLCLFTTLARDERLFEKFFAGSLLDRGNLTIRQREIVIDRTTALCGSEYEWGIHVALFASRAALTEEHIYSLVHGDGSDDCWTDEDRVLLRVCDELHSTASLSDETWSLLRERFGELAILELMMLAGLYRMVSYLTNALHLPLEAQAQRFPPRRVY